MGFLCADLAALVVRDRSLWEDSILTWAHSQRSRRIVLRCAAYEQRALDVLLDSLDERRPSP